jgi:thioredoxin-like negative regulator of GroEL
MFSILLFTMVDFAWSQEKAKTSKRVEAITDDNFKKKIAKGWVLVKFTAAYQFANLDPKLFDGIKGFEGCVILTVENEKARKVIKKLRLRNFPSLAIFHNGKKMKVWKADMDGVVDVTSKDIKKVISDAMAGDVF